MSILNQKKKIMGNVAALNVITEGLPKFKPLDSFSSINNSTNATDFLMDLIQSLIGYEDLKSNIVDMLTRKLPEIETVKIKTWPFWAPALPNMPENIKIEINE